MFNVAALKRINGNIIKNKTIVSLAFVDFILFPKLFVYLVRLRPSGGRLLSVIFVVEVQKTARLSDK